MTPEIQKMAACDMRMHMRMALLTMIFASVFSGCSTLSMQNPLLGKEKAEAMKQVMARQDKIVFLSSPELDPGKPVFLLLHGATDDPTEMMDIARESSAKFNVLLYAFNQHHSIEQLAKHLLTEMKELKAKIRELRVANSQLENLTILTFSYSAAVFRKTVLMSHDTTLFSGASLIQLVPAAGGSYLARGMGNPVVASLVSLASKRSAAVNPYGRIADELWGRDGNQKFYAVINPERMHTILVEQDPHSLAQARNEELQRRYKNGIGANIIVLPMSTGANHGYLPTHPAALQSISKLLGGTSGITQSDQAKQSKAPPVLWSPPASPASPPSI